MSDQGDGITQFQKIETLQISILRYAFRVEAIWVR